MLLRDMNTVFDGGGRFRDGGNAAENRDPSATGDNAPDVPPPAPPPVEGAPPPIEGGGDQPQGGEQMPTPPPALPPPAQATMMPSIQASDATGGVQGSFAQAGTSGFNRRFGGEAPAQWFQRMAAPNQQFSGRQSATTQGGAVQGGAAQAVANGMNQEGKPQDEEWQRFMREVSRKRFGSA